MNSKNKEFLDIFIAFLRDERRYSVNTILAYEDDIKHFVSFIESEDLGDLDEISDRIAEFYLAKMRDEYTPKSIQRKVSSLKSMYHYLVDYKRLISFNPFYGITLPKVEKKLPKFIYENEVNEFMKSINTKTEIGKRDKLMFSLLYGSGLRVSELTSLKLKDVNIEDRILTIHGKGSKDRLVPMNSKTIKEFNDYLYNSRPYLLARSNFLKNEAVFLNFKGTALTSRGVRDILDRILEETSSNLRVSPHTFRHSFATHLLNKGMDVRMVQELLGHSNLSTTQIYTKISRESLINEYDKAFPKGDKKEDD